MIIKSSIDVLNICKSDDVPIYEVAIDYEMKKKDVTRKFVLDKMNNIFFEMKRSVNEGLHKEDNSYEVRGKMFKDYGVNINNYRQHSTPLLGDVSAKAVAYALSVMEVNCSMGKVVASPTAGSCGVLPAVLLSTLDTLKLDEEHAVYGLLTAGIVGAIIARNATLSGAEGGCQAEIGSASAMAAAAAVEMAGGTPQMSFDAAAITLKNIMGLVCDPVASLVEIPCVKRNGHGVLNALMSADMVLAGIKSVIPFDEVVGAMERVGRQMPTALKETSEGGIADTPTARKLENQIF